MMPIHNLEIMWSDDPAEGSGYYFQSVASSMAKKVLPSVLLAQV